MHVTPIRNRNDAIARGLLIPLGDKASIESGLIYPITIGLHVEYRIDDVTDASVQDLRREQAVSAWATRRERHDNMLDLLRTVCRKGLEVDAVTQELEFRFEVEWHGHTIKAELYTGNEGLPAWLIWTADDVRAVTRGVELAG